MSDLKLVLFDCDGTLLDGQHMILDAMRSASKTCGAPYPQDDKVRRIVGLSLGVAIERLFPAQAALHEDIRQAFVERFHFLRETGQSHEPLYEGIREMIEKLHAAGILLGVATGKSRRGLKYALEHHALSDYFVTLNTADDGPGKPDPAMVYNALKETGVTAQNTLMVGDTTFDIHMARAAKVTAVGVTWGYHEEHELVDAGADHMLHHISGLAKLVGL